MDDIILGFRSKMAFFVGPSAPGAATWLPDVPRDPQAQAVGPSHQSHQSHQSQAPCLVPAHCRAGPGLKYGYFWLGPFAFLFY